LNLLRRSYQNRARTTRAWTGIHISTAPALVIYALVAGSERPRWLRRAVGCRGGDQPVAD